MRKLRLLLAAVSILGLASGVDAAEIHDAVQAKNINVVRQLLAADSSLVSLADETGMTALHYAARSGETGLVQVLLDAGAIVDARDSREFTPIFWAAFFNHKEVVELLADHGADLQQTHPMFGALLDGAFHAECQRGWSGVTEFLISRGVAFDPDFVGPFGMSRLHVAVVFGNEQVVQFLFDHDANVNIIRERDGMTPLADAANRGRTGVVKLLLAHGGDVNRVDNSGNPPLLRPVENGHAEIVRLLLAAGAKTDFVDTLSGQTLLHRAAISGHVEIMRALLDAGANLHDLDNYERSALYYAGRYGHRQLAELLLARGAQTTDELKNNFGTSPDLSRTFSTGEAVVWYLNGRGWAIKTKNHFFVIDAEEFGLVRPTDPALANGFLTPAEIGDQNLVTLYTCYHGSVGEPAYIHQIEDSLTSALYIHNQRDPWRGCRNSAYLNPREEHRSDDLRVVAFNVADDNPVNGYVCQVDGITFFYPGFQPEDIEQYKKEVDFLGQQFDEIDFAFLPIAEPGEENVAAQYVVEKLHPRAIFPMDPNRREQLFNTMQQLSESRGSTADVLCAENPGDRFTYRRR